MNTYDICYISQVEGQNFQESTKRVMNFNKLWMKRKHSFIQVSEVSHQIKQIQRMNIQNIKVNEAFELSGVQKTKLFYIK